MKLNNVQKIIIPEGYKKVTYCPMAKNFIGDVYYNSALNNYILISPYGQRQIINANTFK